MEAGLLQALSPGLFPWFAKHLSICWLGVKKGGGTERALLTHYIFQPGLFVFIVHTSPVYLDQRWQNQQQQYADRDLLNSYQRHDRAQTCSSCSSPHPLSFCHCMSFLPYLTRTAPCLPGSTPSLELLFSGVAKWNLSFPSRTGRRRWEEGGTRAPQGPLALRMVWLLYPLLCIPPDTAATIWFSALH